MLLLKRSFLVRTISYVLLVLAVAALLIAVRELSKPGASGYKRFDVGRADVNVVVRSDTTVVVSERLRFRFSDHPFSGAYRDIPLQPGVRLRSVRISDDESGTYKPGASAVLGSAGNPGTFGVAQLPGGGVRIVWHYEADGGERTFNLSYRLLGSAEAYDDAVLIPAAIWGDQWTFALDRLRGRVSYPSAKTGAAPIQAWRRPGQLVEQPKLTPDGATLAVDRALPGQQVTLSVAYPRKAFASVKRAQQHPGETLAELRKREDLATGGTSLAARVADKIVPISVLLVLLTVAAMLVLLIRARELPTGVPRHLPGPPSQEPPAVAYGLANEGITTERLVLATLLDLIDRGYYVAHGTGTADDELDLEVALLADERSNDGLLRHEIVVRDFFDRLIGKKPGRLSELSERIPRHNPKWRRRWEEMNASLKRAAARELDWDRDYRTVRWTLAVVVGVAFLVVTVVTSLRTHDLPISVLAGVIAVGLPFVVEPRRLRRLSLESRERQEQWVAFARWTKDFPRLDDDPPATLLLWRRILVYAVAFGTADRVAKSGRIPASVMAEASQRGDWSSGLADGSSYGFLAGHAGGFGSGFSNQVGDPPSGGSGSGSSSGSSSGGSGGGGGFSGGGGGGAW